eukprot:gene13921-19851_t
MSMSQLTRPKRLLTSFAALLVVLVFYTSDALHIDGIDVPTSTRRLSYEDERARSPQAGNAPPQLAKSLIEMNVYYLALPAEVPCPDCLHAKPSKVLIHTFMTAHHLDTYDEKQRQLGQRRRTQVHGFCFVAFENLNESGRAFGGLLAQSAPAWIHWGRNITLLIKDLSTGDAYPVSIEYLETGLRPHGWVSPFSVSLAGEARCVSISVRDWAPEESRVCFRFTSKWYPFVIKQEPFYVWNFLNLRRFVSVGDAFILAKVVLHYHRHHQQVGCAGNIIMTGCILSS